MKARLAAMEAEAAKLREVGTQLLPYLQHLCNLGISFHCSCAAVLQCAAMLQTAKLHL